MPFTTAAKHRMLAALGATHAAAFQGVPGAGGTELDRKPITWAAPANGSMAAGAQPVFDIGPGETVDYVGYYDAASGGTLLAYDDLTAETYAGAGTYTLTGGTLSLTD